MKRVRTMAAAAMGFGLLAGACGGPSQGSTTPAAPADLTAALAGLCRAADQAREGDMFEARRTFLDRSHAFLHSLAIRAEERPGATVARMLEAKQRVEVALVTERGGSPAEVGALLLKLEAATRELAEALGTPAPRCGAGP